MNIADKLRAINQSRKRREALIFHRRTVGGVSVQPEFWSDTLELIKALFKELKKRRFRIDINHWGEIVLTEPERGIQVFLLAHQKLPTRTINEIKSRLSNADYAISEEQMTPRRVQLEFIANRYRAKRHLLRLPAETGLFECDFSNMVDQITASVAGLNNTGAPLVNGDIMKVSSDDISCVINYGAAKLGPTSQFAHLLEAECFKYEPHLKVLGGDLIVKSYTSEDTFMLNQPSKKMLAFFFNDDYS